MNKIDEFLNIRRIKYLTSTNKKDAIIELAAVFNSDEYDTSENLVEALLKREDLMSTGIGYGLAMPHARLESVKEISFACGISKKGIYFDSIDESPVQIIIMTLADKDRHKYLRFLKKLMVLLKDESIRKKIIDTETAEEVMDILSTSSIE
jgi:nitrogen PTS system EIIA component